MSDEATDAAMTTGDDVTPEMSSTNPSSLIHLVIKRAFTIYP